MNKVLLDTNFILTPFQFKLDLFSELKKIIPNSQVFILDKSFEELKKIKNGFYLNAVKKFVEINKIGILKTKEKERNLDVDDLLLIFGEKGYIVATNDKELKQRLEEKNISYIFMRQKKVLEIRKFE